MRRPAHTGVDHERRCRQGRIRSKGHIMKAHTFLGIVAVGALALSGCSGGGGGTADGGEPVVDGTLRFAINEDPGSLFRPANSSATLSYVYPWAYESPVYFDTEGQPQGWLAESWEDSPTSVSFTIRDDAMCSDGTKLTAETVANNYRWIADPANGSSFLGLVVPADATVENDENTVTLTTATPNSFLLTALGTHPIYCQAALDDPESTVATTNGTGLFQLTEAVPGDHYTLERRDDYTWGPEGAPNGGTAGVPKEVVISVIENASTRANLLLSGELNIAAVAGPDEDRVAGTIDPYTQILGITGGFVYSQAAGQPTADKNVRLALTKALDLDALMQVNTAGRGERATRLAVTPPQVCQYDAATPNLPSTDIAGAEKMLDAAGWVKGADGMRSKDGEPLVLDFAWQTRWAENAATAELMADQWAEIGVGVTHYGTDYGAFMERVAKEGSASELDVIWIAPNYPVPSVLSSFFSGPAPTGGNNFGEVSNPEFDRLVGETVELTGADACGAWEVAEAEMFASADYVSFAMRPDVTYGRGIKSVIQPTGMDTFVTGVILVTD